MEITVTDARDAYLSWNRRQYENLDSEMGEDRAKIVHLLPLLLHENHRALPGYSGPNFPVGIYAYEADGVALQYARQLNPAYQKNEHEITRFPAIDSVFLQRNLLDQSLRCWVFARSTLNNDQLIEIKDKVNLISRWCNARNLKLEFIVTTEEKFRKYKVRGIDVDNRSIFIEQFYAEALLLAGKYPAWWLVSPSDEISYQTVLDHIHTARLVDVNALIDLGGIHEVSCEDYVQAALTSMKKFREVPEQCLLELIQTDIRVRALPNIDGVAVRIKAQLYEGFREVIPRELLADMMHECFGHYDRKDFSISPSRLMSGIRNMPVALDQRLIDLFLGDAYQQPMTLKGIENLIAYMNVNKALVRTIRRLFTTIIEIGKKKAGTDSEILKGEQVSSMLSLLSENAGRVPLYNTKDVRDLVLERVLLRQTVFKGESQWALVIKSGEANEKKVEGFGSLLEVLCWCWFNRLVNHSTQVSVDCPMQQVTQVEARFMLENLMAQLNPALLSNIGRGMLDKPATPLNSIVFVNFLLQMSDGQNQQLGQDNPLGIMLAPQKLVTHCEQVVVNSWGEVVTRAYDSEAGTLDCLCEWTHHAPVGGRNHPQRIVFSGYGSGNSTFLAHRIEQVYLHLLEYFYGEKNADGRFIVMLDKHYYCIAANNSLLYSQKIGDVRKLFDFLAASSQKFVKTELERLAYTAHPLKEIYRHNKSGVFQVFFEVINQAYYSWVLDERGSLYRRVDAYIDRNSFLRHWQLVYRHIKQQMQVEYENTGIKVPEFELNHIVINRLGLYEFVPVVEKNIAAEKQFYDVRVRIKHGGQGEELSFYCGDREFTYELFEDAALSELVSFLEYRKKTRPDWHVYVTDVDVPMTLIDIDSVESLQSINYLRLIQAFEKRINKAIEL